MTATQKSMKLNQVLAVEKTLSTRVENDLTAIYQMFKHHELFVGMSSKYEPKMPDGDKISPEQKQPQYRATDQLQKIKELLAEQFDIRGQKDATNCVAKANVIIDGKIILENVPATHLLFLEAKLVNIIDLLGHLPQLDPAVMWNKEGTVHGLWKTPETTDFRTKKVLKPVILVAATDKHPAQVEKTMEDVIEGTYHKIKFSTALPGTWIEDAKKRVQKLQTAVKQAREQANMVDVVDLKSSPILDYVFGATP